MGGWWPDPCRHFEPWGADKLDRQRDVHPLRSVLHGETLRLCSRVEPRSFEQDKPDPGLAAGRSAICQKPCKIHPDRGRAYCAYNVDDGRFDDSHRPAGFRIDLKIPATRTAMRRWPG